MSFNFMAAVNIHNYFGAQENKICHVANFPPSVSHEVMGPVAMILVFWMLSFKPAFSLSSFTLIKRLFSSSLLSAIRVVTSAYLKLLTFLLAIFIQACEFSSPAFFMMYSACKLNKQGDNMLDILFSEIGTSALFCCFLSCIQVSKETGKVVWISVSSRIFHNVLWSTQRI